MHEVAKPYLQNVLKVIAEKFLNDFNKHKDFLIRKGSSLEKRKEFTVSIKTCERIKSDDRTSETLCTCMRTPLLCSLELLFSFMAMMPDVTGHSGSRQCCFRNRSLKQVVSTDEQVPACNRDADDLEQYSSFSSSSAIFGSNCRRKSYDGKKKNLSFLLRNKNDFKSSESSPVVCSRRLHNGSSPAEVASIRVLRRRKKDKWKSSFITLKETSASQLFIYDSETCTRPKMILDLCYCFLFKIDESVVHHANCIFLVSNGSDICLSVYLAFLSFCDFNQWFGFLRKRCFGCRRPTSPFAIFSADPSVSFNFLSFVYLTIHDYRGSNLNPECDYSACVLINGIRITQTTPATPVAKNYVSFNAQFLIENVPSRICNLQLQLVPYKQKKIGRQCIQKPYGSISSANFSLMDEGNELRACGENGFVFSAILHKIIILPEESYAPFFYLLTSQSFLLCLWTGSMLDTFNCRHFVRHLLTLFLPTPSILLSFIDVVLESQLQRETGEDKIHSSATLFRLDTFCSSCISTALRIVGRDAVLYELSPMLQRLHCEKPTAVDVETFVVALRKLASHLPYLLRAILARVVEGVRKHFPDDPSCSRRAVSCFFILRFLNPILTFWNITGGPARKLAKAVQEAANQASSVNFDPQSGSRAAALMSQILDDFTKVKSEPKEIDNYVAEYNKEEHFAMLAFEIGRVFEENPDCCPLPETASVLASLKNQVEISTTCH